MKKPHLLVITLLIFTFSLTAQTIERQLIGVAGYNNSANQILLDWTLGEAFTTFNNVSFGYFKEGFLQPGDLSQIQIEDDNDKIYLALSDHFSVEVFPNPFKETFTIQLNKAQESALRFIILDYSGKTLKESILAAGSLTMECSMDEYPAGLYFLQFDNTSGTLSHSFKLLKL